MTFPAMRGQHGLSLIEVLITAAILSVGLLGLAGLQASAHMAERESLSKAQALVLAQDMADRIAANRGNAKLGSASAYNSTTVYGIGNPDATCISAPTSAVDVASKDLCEWDLALKGATQTVGGSKAAVLSGARGCIALQTSPIIQFVVTVAWAGNSAMGSPPSDRPCGSAAIPAMRHVVSFTVPLANLSN